jgi:uncharacterized protein (DUF697 family)
MAQIKTKVHEANEIVKKYMVGSVVVGLVPLPWVDMIALTALQLKMLHRLANLYGIEFSENRGKSLITSLLGGGVPVSFSRNVINWLKSVPFYGQVTGMISMFVFGSASTYAVGKVFIQHFESGGTFLTFDPQKVADYYAKQLEVGKAEVKKSHKRKKPEVGKAEVKKNYKRKKP